MSAVAIVVSEVALLVVYVRWDAPFHWLVHFLVGGSVALVVLAAVTVTAQRSVDTATLLPVVAVGHLVAAVPDLLFRVGIAHEHWMDLFFWHLESHFAPGGVVVWYAVFLICLGTSLLLQWRAAWWPPIAAAFTLGTTLVLAHERVPPQLTNDAHLMHLVSLLLLPVATVTWVWWYRAHRRCRPSPRFSDP